MTRSRTLEHLIALSNELQARGVDLVVLDQGIDTSTALGQMLFQILGTTAEFERTLMSERTRDGLAVVAITGPPVLAANREVAERRARLPVWHV